jgi:SpoVK/Ycf46/Vps4 family AAA+-type ATPase
MKMTTVENVKKFISELESILYFLQADDAVWNEFDAMTERYLGNKIHEILQDDITEEIAIVWHIEDVQSIRSDLTDQQASEVLIHLKKNHDATVGINWDTIETVADILFPSEGSPIECEEDSI